ncbi:2-oxoglutarate dehydrogenase, E2 component, dihydrolipoamide succinyltransferase [Janibacter hoylei PVAS-1]|uniref:Dihydrolipoamide acetyltransferase component of pyruvate dehydrogenase complex n=1 Tax=Janibacter hoylei PVAS-1 TaxID=1210046 RepID=A0A444B622_9MICO|nr:2-oxoglutarate dehydrogenase, E2 component, dihydrolipoamide succinyltransferase [Janibacter hoylei]RWU83814.1 2-oxoglutarate dehydrogenase, E2 component, dihydrolipoamide succinyltransferase [Janibacter hoylei PVAS-1]
MSERVTMPALGESVTEGTVTRWLKNVGDTVEVDEPLLEVSTDKVDTEIPSPVAGTIQEILVEEDETVEVGADLAVIGDGDAPASSDSGDDAQEAPAEETPAEEPQADEPAAEAEEAPAEEPQAEEAPAAESSSGDGDGTTVAMPALGESVTEGTVSRWLKAEGDTVEVDEPLLEVSTDKVDTEIPSPVAGTLTKILVQEDETVEVGADLAIVGGSGGGSTESAPAEEPKQEAPTEEPKAEEPKEEPKAEEPKEEPKQEAPKEEPKQEAPKEEPKQEAPKEEPKQEAPKEEPKAEEPKAEPKQEVPAASGGDAAAYVTPLVRKLAADNGIDLAQVTGTGIGGRIRKQDVLQAAKAKNQPQEAAAPAAAPAGAPAAAAPAGVPAGLESNVPQSKRGTREKMTRLRKVIAERMVESLRVSAQLTTVVEVDMTKVARVRDAAKAEFAQREGTKLSFLPFIAQATAEALKAHPGVNASVEGDEIVYHSQENLSIAVDTERGLLTPVVKNAGDLNVAGLARAIADVADRTRNNKITPDDLSGGTFTITNTGSRGALFDTPILNQPQVAMLGTGAIVRRPVVITTDDGGETLAIRSMMYLALTYDHRVVDGADAARFLGTVKARLEEGRFEA